VRNTHDREAFRLIPVLGEGADPAQLPPFLQQQQYVDLRDRQRAPEHIRRLVETLRSPAPSQAAIPAEYWTTHSPFRSLQIFGPEDSWLFFGRDDDTKEVLTRLGRAPTLAVIGNSGSGKSSLIQAGLIPALRRGRFQHGGKSVDRWRIAVFRPSASPFDYLAETLARQLAPELSATERANFIDYCKEKLPAGGEALRTAIAALISPTSQAAEDIDVLLVADQFEELFTLVPDPAIRSRYIDSLLTAIGLDGAVRVRLMLAVRADFYANCLDHAKLGACLDANLYNVPLMSHRQLREAIENRLALATARAEVGLIDALLADVGAEPGNLALLEHALAQLWEKSGGAGQTLTNGAYAEIGRLRGALGRHADAVYRGLGGEAERHLAQQIFLELVQLGEGAPDTRRRVPKEDLLHLGAREQVDKLIATLASQRLVATSGQGPEAPAENFVEVSHEALIREWPALREWLTDNREDLRLGRSLLQAAEEWRDLNRDGSALMQGIRLAQGRKWLAEHRVDAPPLLREFLVASCAAEEQSARKRAEEERRKRRRAYVLAASASVVAIVVGLLAVFANTERRNAQLALAQSDVQEGTRLFDAGRPDQAAAYFARALRSTPASVAATSWISDLLLNRDWWLPGALLQHQKRVRAAAFSPDGRLVVTASWDNTARVWEAGTGKPVAAPLRHKGPVNYAAFSPDGRLVVTASLDNTARVWEVDTGKPVGRPLQHQEQVLSAAFSPNGRRVVTASWDNTARVWEVDTGKPVGTPLQHQKQVLSAAFSPDGRRVVTASLDNTARVWEADTGKPVGAPLQHQDLVQSAAFSPDGRRVVTASFDSTARVWEADTGMPLGAPLQHQGAVSSAAFSPDGRRVVTASFDSTARVWEADTGMPLGVPLQHQGAVSSAAFSRDGLRVVTASSDKTARVWEADTGKRVGAPLQHRQIVLSATFSPDGRRLVTASWDKNAQVWEADTGKPVGTPLQYRNWTFAAFSPDGRRVVTASSDKTAQVREADTGKPVGAPLQHQGKVNSAAFSPDGRRVVTGSQDNTARVWEADTGKPVGALLQHQGKVNSAAFSPDGRRVVTGSQDNTARVWEADTGKPVGAPLRHQGGVVSVAFSPDGRRVVTASNDNSARVWEADTGKPVGAPLQQQALVYSAAFSPDGRRVVTASRDNTARVWEADTGKPVGTPLQHQGQVYSAAFSPDGRRVVTASQDNTARVWDASTGTPVGALLLHQGQVRSAAISADGRRVVTASDDGTARVWEADTGKPVGAPLQHQRTVTFAAFSPDGHWVETVSGDTARLWAVLLACCASQEEAKRLASLAEAVSGNELSDTGSLRLVDGRERLQKPIRQSGSRPAAELSLDWIIRRFTRAK
jgi:WD40 repeat protein